MANPRKFSEKIALHNQKQAEETAAFEKILREVSVATSKVDEPNGKLAKSAIANHSDNIKNNNYRESRHRSVGVGPMRSRAVERKVDTFPYSSNTYLSPPPDSSWRRTNSDSALHQSLLQSVSNNAINGNSRWPGLVPTLSNNDIAVLENTLNNRMRSCGKSPRVPGIHIYPSVHEPGTLQIPIGNNTGSLPDLTSVHYPSTTTDNEIEHNSSPYSSNQSPLSASPSTLSPTSVTSRLRSNSANFQYINNLSQQTYTSENNFSAILDALDFQPNQSPPSDGIYYNKMNNNINRFYEQKCSSASQSPTNVPVSTSSDYRSPNSRSSQQSSPGVGSRNSETNSPANNTSPLSNDYFLNQSQNSILQHLEQFSMDWAQLVQSLVDSGCTWSTQSQIDTTTPMSTTTSYDELLNNVQVQNQIGGSQVQMQMQMQNHSHNQSYTAKSTSSQSQYSHQSQNNSSLPNIIKNPPDLPVDNNFFNTSSNLVYTTASISLHTSPNTPTSIPDIILTDFSNNEECLSQHDIGNELNDKIDQTYYLTESNLKDNTCLSTIDFDGLQLLADTEINLISDSADDQFRLEDF